MRPSEPLYIATLHRPSLVLGGIQQHVKVFARYCEGLGVQPVLVSPFHASKSLVYPLFGLRRLLAGGWNARWYDHSHYRLLLHVLKRRIDRRGRSFIYAQDPVSARAALELRSAGWDVAITMTAHFNISIADEWAGKGYIGKDDATFRSMLERDDAVLRAVDRLVFVSDYMRREVNRRIPDLDRQRQTVVPNAIYAPPVHRTARCSDGGDLISIGGLEPRKNHEFLIRVLAAARARGSIYTLTIVGDGPLRSSLQRLADSLGVSSQVTFAGAIPDAAPLIARHRVYVHAARMENLCIVIIEALAAGRPVFAAPVGGVPELFRDGVEGRMWHLSDPERAADALISVLDNPKVYGAMSEAARRRYEAAFTPEATQPRLFAAIFGRSATLRAATDDREYSSVTA
jgi:glycosyltransferase involved in cell wall biosynthesis